MKRIALLSTTGLALMLATPALAAECTASLTDYNREKTEAGTYRYTVDQTVRRDIRTLRDAAALLERSGQEDACEAVVAAIKEMSSEERAAEDKVANQDEWNKREIDRLKAAKSLDQLAGRIGAEQIIGSEVRNGFNEELGEIEDVMLATKQDQKPYAIISYGGFIGLGDKQVAVPMDRLMVTDDRDVFVLNLSTKDLENAPAFDRDKFSTIYDDQWRQTNDKWWSERS